MCGYFVNVHGLAQISSGEEELRHYSKDSVITAKSNWMRL